MKVTVKKLNRFLMFKLPAAYLCGVRLRKIHSAGAIVTVRFKWINQNPFNSMYFAVQSMASELSTGVILIKKIRESGRKISMLIINHKGAFTKKAVGKISFTCTDGVLVDEVLEATIRTGEGQILTMKSVGKNEHGEVVSEYEYEWSVKIKNEN